MSAGTAGSACLTPHLTEVLPLANGLACPIAATSL